MHPLKRVLEVQFRLFLLRTAFATSHMHDEPRLVLGRPRHDGHGHPATNQFCVIAKMFEIMRMRAGRRTTAVLGAS